MDIEVITPNMDGSSRFGSKYTQITYIHSQPIKCLCKLLMGILSFFQWAGQIRGDSFASQMAQFYLCIFFKIWLNKPEKVLRYLDLWLLLFDCLWLESWHNPTLLSNEQKTNKHYFPLNFSWESFFSEPDHLTRKSRAFRHTSDSLPF